MKPKIKMSTVINILGIVLAGCGAALGQWASMKEWKEEMTEKAEENENQLPE